MSIDISAAPAAGAKAVVPHGHTHGHAHGAARGNSEHEGAAAFTDLLSGKDKQAAAPKDGEAKAKPAGHGATKWNAREHAQWRVFDAMNNGGPDRTADEPEAKDAKDDEVPVDAEGQVRQTAMVIGHAAKAAAAAAGGDHAREGAAVAREAGAEATAIDTGGQPGRKRLVAEGVQTGAPEQHAIATKNAQRGSSEPVRAGREAIAEMPKPAESATAVAPEAARERGARVQEHEPARERPAQKVAVLSVQSAPTPVAPASTPAMSPTAASFVQSLGSADGLTRYVSETGTQTGAQQPSGHAVTTLKIQLHPVDLGTVTAKISGDSDKLSIEVQVESHKAHHQLQSDSDSIVKALRGMGFDIDRITVQQAPQSGAAQGGATNRENAFAAPDQRAGDGRGQSGRQDSGRGYDDGRNHVATGERGEAGGGSGVYI